MPKFLHKDDDNNNCDAKAIAIPRFFPKTADVKMMVTIIFSLSQCAIKSTFFQVINSRDYILTHSLIYNFETAPNSKKLQTTTEMWLLKDFKK